MGLDEQMNEVSIEMIKEGRKKSCPEAQRFGDSKASGLTKHLSSVNTRKASLKSVAHGEVSGKVKFP
jgi:hypothetical protein